MVARASTERGRASKQRLLQTRSLRQGPRPLSLVFRSAQQHPGNPEPCWCFALSGGPSLLQRLAGWKVPVYAGYGSAALNENPTSPHHPCPDQLASGKGDGGSQADLGAIPGRGKRLRAQPRRKKSQLQFDQALSIAESELMLTKVRSTRFGALQFLRSIAPAGNDPVAASSEAQAQVVMDAAAQDEVLGAMQASG